MIRRKVFVGLACLLVSSGGIAVRGASSSWLSRDWQSDDGLPDNDVIGVAQTTNGFLWVGTAGGLMRFDGVRFHEWPLAELEGIPNRVVRAMTLDRNGKLWVAMDRGPIVCLEAGGTHVFTEGLPDSRVSGLADDADGAIWICYGNGGMARMKGDQVTLLGLNLGLGLPPSAICIATRDSKGRVWFGKASTVGIIRNGELVPLLDVKAPVQGIGARRDGGIWISAGSRLLAFDEDRELQEFARDAPEPASIDQKALLEDRSGAIWVGTSASGLFRYANSRWQQVPTSHHSITCLMEDQEGNIWAGTSGAGLDRLRPRVIELIGTESGLPFESVRSASEDTDGAVWVTTQNGLLARLKDEAWTVVSRMEEWPGGYSTCVAADQDGGVWAGTADRGLNHWREGRWRTFRPGSRGLASTRVRSLLPSASGDVWIATDDPVRVQRLRGDTIETVELPTASRTIRALAEDANGVIWVGSADGQLFRIDGDSVVNLAPKLSERLLSIRCLYATPDGCLWIGFAGWGVGRLKGDHFVRITTVEGLHDDYISQIVADENGWLWCAGNRGIFQVRLQELADVAEGRAERVRSITHGPGEGLHNLQPNYDNAPASFRGRDGRIWFGMRTGLAVVHSEDRPHNTVPPPVILDRVVVDGQVVALYDSKSPVRSSNRAGLVDLRRPDGVVRLPPGHRKIDIDFTALSFTAPENVRILYRLKGVDQEWGGIAADMARSVSYSRLAAGRYEFQVKACNNDGVWNETGASLGIVVAPFFYNTWWFHSTMITTFTLSLIGVVRYVSFRRLRRRLRLLEEQDALHRERARIAKDIHDDLGASLTQIAFLGELAQQDQGEPQKAAERSEKISVTARQAIKSLDEIVWAVNPRNDTLAHLIDYVGQHALDFLRVADIRCRLDLPETAPQQEVSTDIRHNLFLAVKEALTNIIKHSRATEVWLRIHMTGESLQVSIEDNGCGFGTLPSDPGADGLRNMQQRLAAIGGVCRIDSKPAAGTRIAFTVPWSRNR